MAVSIAALQSSKVATYTAGVTCLDITEVARALGNALMCNAEYFEMIEEEQQHLSFETRVGGTHSAEFVADDGRSYFCIVAIPENFDTMTDEEYERWMLRPLQIMNLIAVPVSKN